MTVSTEHETKFLCAFARAILVWQYVDNTVYMIFNTVLSHNKPEIVSAAFYAVINFEARLSMVNETIIAAIHDAALLDRWKRLYKRTRECARARNKFAHYSATMVQSGDKPAMMKIMPTVFRISSHAGNEYDLKQINEIRGSFHRLADDLLDFQGDIARHLGHKPTLPL